jgi:hypothetical protein
MRNDFDQRWEKLSEEGHSPQIMCLIICSMANNDFEVIIELPLRSFRPVCASN